MASASQAQNRLKHEHLGGNLDNKPSPGIYLLYYQNKRYLKKVRT